MAGLIENKTNFVQSAKQSLTKNDSKISQIEEEIENEISEKYVDKIVNTLKKFRGDNKNVSSQPPGHHLSCKTVRPQEYSFE